MYAAADAKMTRRNGSVIKYVVCVLFVLGGVYFIYLYNDVSGKLTESERVAEKYRRSEESLSSQLQDISAGKEELRQRCEAEKKEFQNRLSSVQQQHKMLKTQNDDLQAEYSKLNMERQKEIDDQKLQESQRNQEYMQLKQEKDLEISSLKDQVANLEREKAQVSETISSLKLQLQNSQTQLSQDQASINYLQQEIRKQQQQLQAQQQQQFQQQGQNAQGQLAGNQAPQNVQGVQNVQQPVQNNNNPVVGGMPVNNQAGNQLNVNSNLDNSLQGGVGAQNVAGHVGVQEMQQNQQAAAQNGLNEAEKAKLIDEHQQQHQVGPPINLDNKSQNAVPLNSGKQVAAEQNANLPGDHEQMKEQEKHPNIQPPNLNVLDKEKYGKQEDTGNDKSKTLSNANHVIKDKEEPVHQILPPGAGVKDQHSENKAGNEHDSNPKAPDAPDNAVLGKPDTGGKWK